MYLLLILVWSVGLSLNQAHAAAAHKRHTPVKAVTRAVQVSLTFAWDAALNPERFVLLRCQVPAGATTCVPGVELPLSIPGSERQATDTTAPPGTTQCWTVKAAAGTQRSAAAKTAMGTPYTCKATGGILPLAGPVVLTPVDGTLHMSWSAPVFTVNTVPSTALTGYEVWRRTDGQPIGPWSKVMDVGPTLTAWDDPGPFTASARWCYQIRAVYGTAGYAENATTCGSAPVAPVVVPAPTNLREVLSATPLTAKPRSR